MFGKKRTITEELRFPFLLPLGQAQLNWRKVPNSLGMKVC